MIDITTSQPDDVELPKRRKGTDTDPSVSQAGEIARALMSDLALGRDVERPRFSVNNPEDLLTPAAKVYLDELKEAFRLIGAELDAGKIDISTTFHGKKIGHYLDDIRNFVDDPEDIAYIMDATNQVLNFIEAGQSQLLLQQRSAIAKDYFDLMQVNGTTREMRRRTVPGTEDVGPRHFFDNLKIIPDEELDAAIEAIWRAYKSVPFKQWQRMVISEGFKEDLGIDELADGNRMIVERYVNAILTSRQT